VFCFNTEPRLNWNENVLAAKHFNFISDVVPYGACAVTCHFGHCFSSFFSLFFSLHSFFFPPTAISNFPLSHETSFPSPSTLSALCFIMSLLLGNQRTQQRSISRMQKFLSGFAEVWVIWACFDSTSSNLNAQINSVDVNYEYGGRPQYIQSQSSCAGPVYFEEWHL